MGIEVMLSSLKVCCFWSSQFPGFSMRLLDSDHFFCVYGCHENIPEIEMSVDDLAAWKLNEMSVDNLAALTKTRVNPLQVFCQHAAFHYK